ncbi:hypothetical protein CGC58_09200 [Capnocytophaga stomatis]|uniref:Uncharacterized protein n=1 Tax=Capnocytophaga stomatis TaxID=1848904 RepID=A0A250G0X3_9FLAO|nr:hypothetical protein [Capnocytophaga stomatis]ATA89886.1 hypothetical protein CGC58_09200 [Capnocytophaga stomatis]
MKKLFTVIIALFTVAISAQIKDIDANAIPKQMRIRCGNTNTTPPLMVINDIAIKDKKVGNLILHTIDSEKIVGIHILKGEEAIEAYGEDAKEGVIKFHLKKNKKNVAKPSSTKEKINSSNEVIYFADNETDKAKEFLKLMEQNSDKISKLRFLKGEKAIKKYGEEAKNGVILVNLIQ